MTVLVGGLRVLGATVGGSRAGVLTERVGVFTNDFFTTITDQGVVWSPADDDGETFAGRGRDAEWSATRVDLLFGANAQLRAVAEVYASDDGAEKLVRDFVAAWDKVMMLDRFDLS